MDLMCIDCVCSFEEDELDDCKCPSCGSSHYDWYDDAIEDDEGEE